MLAVAVSAVLVGDVPGKEVVISRIALGELPRKRGCIFPKDPARRADVLPAAEAMPVLVGIRAVGLRDIQAGWAAVEVARMTEIPSLLQRSMMRSSWEKSYCSSEGCSRPQEKTFRVSSQMCALWNSRMSSSQISSGHCSGLQSPPNKMRSVRCLMLFSFSPLRQNPRWRVCRMRVPEDCRKVPGKEKPGTPPILEVFSRQNCRLFSFTSCPRRGSSRPC